MNVNAAITGVPCSYCHAAVGARCTSADGGRRAYPHAARYRLWRETVENETEVTQWPPSPLGGSR